MGYTLGADEEPEYNDDATNPGPVGDFQAAVDWASKIGGLLKGTSAERQDLTASQVRQGWLFVENDTGRIYRRTASGWDLIHTPDTGWQELTLNPGWSTYLGETPRWRVRNGVLQLAGRISAGAGATVEVATLPAAARHTSTVMVFRLHYDNGVAGITVASGGLIAVFEPGAAASRPGISLAQVMYLVG